MIQKIKNKLMILASTLMLVLPVAVPATVAAQDGPIQGGLCLGAQELVIREGQATCEDPDTDTGFTDLLRRIINIVSVIIGVIAVLMIIWGGFKYITSGGAQDRVKSAKDTLLYAIIGLIIVALAQIVVRFVLSQTSSVA